MTPEMQAQTSAEADAPANDPVRALSPGSTAEARETLARATTVSEMRDEVKHILEKKKGWCLSWLGSGV